VARLCASALALGATLAVRAADPAPRAPDTVVVPSGTLKLQGLLFRPAGRGPFPAVLFNHGSGHARGSSGARPDQRHPELLGPVFARHGYLFLYLYRRGDGLSAGQGMAAGDVMDQALASGGQDARNQAQLHLLETDEMDDAVAGLTYLRAQPDADPARVAVIGHSFGGSLTLLLAARDPSIRAIVTFAAVGYSWDRSPQLRAKLTAAVARMSAAAFLISAANDFSLGPERELPALMERPGGPPHRVRIYPPAGQTPEEGHDFIHSRVSTWEPDVFAFLGQYLSQSAVPGP
jgi:dienelactone hydrolase